ncbi:MAG TPA: hypothetical protein VHC23_03365 [Jatrophihabitans sp.]|nr:hypothetical protein [Jatrophihabitans sp.]
MIAALLDALIPPTGDRPGGSIAEPALLAEPEAARVLAGYEPGDDADDPMAAWARLVAAEPEGTGAVLQLLAAAYFADPRVRTQLGLDRLGRPEPQPERLAALLATVPPAPRLPERSE